jgi:hypothetical protein
MRRQVEGTRGEADRRSRRRQEAEAGREGEAGGRRAGGGRRRRGKCTLLVNLNLAGATFVKQLR